MDIQNQFWKFLLQDFLNQLKKLNSTANPAQFW